MIPHSITIIGLGLVGGSLALSLHRRYPELKVIGIDVNHRSLAWAREKETVHLALPELTPETLAVDLIIIAVPPAAAITVLQDLGSRELAPEIIITDVLSTKRSIEKAYKTYLPAHFKRCVGGHPIAGSEKSGAEHSRDDLFGGSQVVLCPQAEQDYVALATVRKLWQDLDGEVVTMSAARHDEIFALTSHLPHILAYGFMSRVRTSPLKDQYLFFAGPGFRDFTRLAGSNPGLWAQICMDNRDHLDKLLALYTEELAAVKQLLATGDRAALKTYFAAARGNGVTSSDR